MDKQVKDAIEAKQRGIVTTFELVQTEADADEFARQSERLAAKIKGYRKYLAAHRLVHAEAPATEMAPVVGHLLNGDEERALRHLEWMSRQERRFARARVLALMPPQVLLPKEKELVTRLLESVDDAERERLEFAQAEAADHYKRVGVIPQLPLR